MVVNFFKYFFKFKRINTTLNLSKILNKSADRDATNIHPL